MKTLGHALLFVAIALIAGCLSGKNPAKAPTVKMESPSGVKLEQSGDAQVPAKIESKKTDTVVALPMGTSVVFDQTLGTVTLHLAQPSTLRQTATADRLEAPRSYTPPAAPTPAELAKGQATLYFWIGLVVGICAAVFGLVRAWNLVMYGGIAVAAGCAFAIFVQDNPLVLWLIGFGVLLKIAGPLIWHTVLKHKQPTATTAHEGTS